MEPPFEFNTLSKNASIEICRPTFIYIIFFRAASGLCVFVFNTELFDEILQ